MLCCTKVKETQVKNTQRDQRLDVLLIGPGDAGKSTFLRQLRVIINADGIPLIERQKFATILQDNCLLGMKTVINECKIAEQDISEELKSKLHRIVSAEELTTNIAECIRDIYPQEFFQQALQASYNTLPIPGGISGIHYYVENAIRFSEPDFVPSHDDVVRAKLRTTGITELNIKVGRQVYNFIDVGGQRSERRKWLHCFQAVHAVIFMIALNEYNMTMEEDGETNRLKESLALFELLSGTIWLKDKPFILFMNKSDLFKKEIEQNPLSGHFTEYRKFAKAYRKKEPPADEYEIGIQFFRELFVKRYQGKNLYAYEMCAVDRDVCDRVFKVVRREIIENACNLSGF